MFCGTIRSRDFNGIQEVGTINIILTHNYFLHPFFQLIEECKDQFLARKQQL